VKALLALLGSILPLLALGNAYAHGDDKPKRGGIMGRGDEISIELVMEHDTVALYIEDHGTPVPTKGAKGTLSVISPGRPARQARLIPAGDNKLTATGLTPISGDRLRAEITLPNGDEVSSVFSFR